MNIHDEGPYLPKKDSVPASEVRKCAWATWVTSMTSFPLFAECTGMSIA